MSAVPKSKVIPAADKALEQKHNITLIKTFVEGAVDTFRVQCNTETQVGKPFKKSTKNTADLNIELVSIIDFTSTKFNGTLALCFPEKTFLEIMSGMLGEEIKEINQDIQDGANELLNIIFGYTKRVLNKEGHEIQMAIPKVIRGKGMDVQQHSNLAPVIIPIKTPKGELFVKIAVS